MCSWVKEKTKSIIQLWYCPYIEKRCTEEDQQSPMPQKEDQQDTLLYKLHLRIES